MKAVRYYSIKTIKDCVTFTCDVCPFFVTVLDFDSLNGSRRTQAARAVNEHAAAQHHRTLAMPSPKAPMLPVR